MKKFWAKLCAIVLVLAMVLPGAGVSAASKKVKVYAPDYTGKTIILHSNDVHGAIEGYAYIKGLKSYFESAGAEVILIDCGDYSQGTPYVSISKGKNAVTMMNAAAYDIAILGNHELDFSWTQLKKNLKKANFKVLCADVFDSKGNTVFDANTVWTTKSGVKIGFFGLETPEAQTKTNPAFTKGLTFAQGEDLYKIAQAQVDELKEKSDLVFCLSHLGINEESAPNTSYDVYNNTTGIDMILDGHSHSVITQGANNEPIQSTGTKFEYIGMVVIDDATKTISANSLIPINEITPFSKTVAKKANKIISKIDKQFGQTFGKTEVLLNGEKAPGNRTEETNLGDLICDALVWEITKDENSVTVDRDHVVALTNGGGIRASVPAGDISMKDINTVLPFGNTVTVVYVTGAELLEALEASTFCTPNAIGGFPQVSGINFTIDTTKEWIQGEAYPESTYYAPKKINRVTINSINGKAFNKKDVYAVITNNFVAAGGDTYYIFSKGTNQFDTGKPLDEVVVSYIQNALSGVVDSTYAEPQGRITVK